MVDLVERIEGLRSRVDAAKGAKLQATTRLQEVQRQLGDNEKAIRAEGVEPDKLDETIQKLEAQLTKDTDACEAQLTKVEQQLKEAEQAITN